MNLNRESIYQLENVTKTYDTRDVLAIDSLAIARGEIFSIVGPSGAGKSTLLRLLAFLETPSAGKIRFEDFSLNGTAPPLELRRRIAMVFQRPLLLNASVRENIALGLRMRGGGGISSRLEPVMTQLGLRDLAAVNARSLSGGEIQRVALARALVLAPDVLLLDEPTANLDPFNVMLIEKIVKESSAERDATIVLVTHNVFQARRLATRVGFLLDGRIIEVAETRAFFESPRDARTRAFVNGEMVY